MACRIIFIDKHLGVCPADIREKLQWDLVKLFLRAAGDQAKIACCNYKLFSGLEACIESSIHAVGNWQW